MPTPSNLSEQILGLPSDAGSVQPPGQSFDVSPYKGTGSYAIAIDTPAGHAGLSQPISLVYSTHGGNGIAGQGWSLSFASIERRTDKGLPSYDNGADLFALQGDELLPAGGGTYRFRIDQRFSRIRHVQTGGRDFWAVTERNGTRVLYGLEPDHRLHDGTGRIAAWYPSKAQDANGNEVLFTYSRDAATNDARLSAFEWAGCYRVRLTYEARPDPVVTHRPGFEHRQQHRLKSVAVEVRRSSDNEYATCRSYVLTYRTSSLTGRSLLTSVGIRGFNPDGSRHDMPPETFNYSEPDLAGKRWHTLSGGLPGGSLKDRNLTLARQSGSGLPDLLETTQSGHWLRINLGDATFGMPERVASPAQVMLEQPGTFISDMSGHGWGDLVVNGGRQVYRARAGGGWSTPYLFSCVPSVDLEAADVRLADYNGDGVPDALRAGVGGWVYFENLRDGRWAPGRYLQDSPPLRFDDPRVHLNDVNGDGLPDLIYMEGRRIRVWPGRGAGRFGPAFELKHPPDFGAAFDPRAVRWIDMTGSGQADLLYVQNGVATVCFNLAGAALSDPAAIGGVPQSPHGHVEPVDLLGNGATGLLFTDYQERIGTWRYLDVFAGVRPDLLTSARNGLGAVSTIEYATSAQFWAADRRAGTPWRTAMPSPQVVVASVTTEDTVTGNRLGIVFRYHNGVYDGVEREFRGFAVVEQIDREASADDPQPLAPALVRRWYHTGQDVDLRSQYSALPAGALTDDVPKLPWALRSLRGLVRREEIFALDGHPRPYSVTETGYSVFPVERSPGTARYSFAPLPVTSRTTYLERGDERRISETTTIYDLHAGSGYGLPVEVREKAFGRSDDTVEPDQAGDLERTTRTSYVHLDKPGDSDSGVYQPVYIVGKPRLVERFGIVGSDDQLLSRDRYFYDGEDYQGLGYPSTGTGAVMTRGLLSCKIVLAFTGDAVSGAFPDPSGGLAHFGQRGRYLRDGDDYYMHAERYRYNARGMITGGLDPNGNETSFRYESAFGLFPVMSVDAAGHPVQLVRGEWPFQVESALDANGNTTSFTYDPSGLLRSKSVQGKYDGSQWSGDPPTHPTETYSYDFNALPVTIVARSRQVRLGPTLDSIRYVDGFGRTVQERRTSEPDPETGEPRYRVSAWKVFNQKGLVVRLYQPAFAASADYQAGPRSRAFVETQYDPLGRAVRINHPDGTYETTTYHPWIRVDSDRNDNSGHITRSDPRYGRFVTGLQKHAGTPARTFFDALGRTIAVAEDNGGEVHTVRRRLDLNDRVVEVHDARGLAAATWSFAFDLAGRRVYECHRTATGERHTLFDAAGNPIWSRDARGIETLRTFDALNRPLETSSDDGSGPKLRRQWRYPIYDEHSVEFAAQQAKNVFGRAEEERDTDGLRFFEYDWRGLATRTSHRFWSQEDGSGRGWDDPDSELWAAGAALDSGIPTTDRDAMNGWMQLPDLIDPTTLAIATTYDAAGRPTENVYPEGVRTRTGYNAAGLLQAVEVDRGTGLGYQTVVDSLAYNARGQLISLRHGNGVETTREYDEDSERLRRIFTRLSNASTVHFQDLAYDYDPVGNPVQITDSLSHSLYTHQQIIPNTRTFEYDPRYRLIRATGKKHRTVHEKTTDVLVPSPDPNDYEPYDYHYAYDAVGNFIRNHEYTSGPVHYKLDRIDLFNGDSTEAGSFTDPGEGNYRYDANGNTTHTPRHEELTYTHDNQVRYANLAGGGQIHYFRHADQRVLRLVRKNGVQVLGVYLGPFEYHWRHGTTSYTKLVLHVEGHDRHARVERVLAGSDPASLERFFHHADHLGSGHVLTKDTGDLLSQEEYFPYGRSSDRRDARNRYRFIGVERDEDTGLCMTGPRTYDPVSGRFLQGDPISADLPGKTPFGYTKSSPLRGRDTNGYADHDPDAWLEPSITVEDIEGAMDTAEALMEGGKSVIQWVENKWDSAINWVRGPARSMAELDRRQTQAERVDWAADHAPIVSTVRAGYVVVMDKDLAGRPADANDKRDALLTGLSPGGVGGRTDDVADALGMAGDAAVNVHDSREDIPGYIQQIHSAKLEAVGMRNQIQHEVNKVLHPWFKSMREWDPFGPPANQGLEPIPAPPQESMQMLGGFDEFQ